MSAAWAIDGSRPGASTDPSLAFLLAHLALCERRVRRAVARRREDDPSPDDPYRGLYVADEHLEWILRSTHPRRCQPPDASDEALMEAAETEATAAEGAGGRVALRSLARTFGLGRLELSVLVVCLAPDLDQRFERLYGYLNDDVTRRRPTVGLALELCAASPFSPADRARLGPSGPLLGKDLLQLAEADRPVLSRLLAVPDRVCAHLLGDDAPDPAVYDLLEDTPPAARDGGAVARALATGATLIHIRERPGAATRSVAVAGLLQAGKGALVVDLARLTEHPEPISALRSLLREGRLLEAGIVAGPTEALLDTSRAGLSFLARCGWPVVLVGRRSWDPRWSSVVPALLDAPLTGEAERARLWREAMAAVEPASESAPPAAGEGPGDGTPLAGSGPVVPVTGFDPAQLTASLLLAPEEMVRAVRAGTLRAAVEARAFGPADLLAGARAQNAAGLDRLTRRISPGVGWDDVVASAALVGELRDLGARARNRAVVLDGWAMRPGGGRGRGITALFAGQPGTGKTMAAEVIAADLGMDLYAVDLATVVDKYIGETEKNLERIFSEAEGVNGVILFDEADALFGKRSEVSDSHDRHANAEVAYLLQRMESFDGLAILATNLRANLDEAFSRRLDAIIEFPMPEAPERHALWEACLGRALPRAGDLDLDFAARSFELAGGSIRSIALTAAYLAAASGSPVTMELLMRATLREYRKLGRLVHESEFGPWLEAARA